jgi:hypothetical protein
MLLSAPTRATTARIGDPGRKTFIPDARHLSLKALTMSVNSLIINVFRLKS